MTQTSTTQAQYPEPDWTTAPAGTRWWAIDAENWAYWFDTKPIIHKAQWRVRKKRTEEGRKNSGRATYLGIGNLNDYVKLPLGCDWRLTLRRRP